MYYKLKLQNDGRIKIVDIVDDKKPDGYIYATDEEFKKLNKAYIDDYANEVEL